MLGDRAAVVFGSVVCAGAGDASVTGAAVSNVKTSTRIGIMVSTSGAQFTLEVRGNKDAGQKDGE